jgi:chromosome segregation ATPase
MISHAAKKSGDTRLAKLLVNARGLHDTGTEAAFDKVKKDIQTMVDKIVQEKEDEIKKRDYCIEMITENEDHTTSKKRDKGDLETAIEDLKMTIEELTAKIEDLKQAIHEAELQLKRAGVDREKQNQEFKVVVADQRATQKLIKVALTVLKGFYDKGALMSF